MKKSQNKLLKKVSYMPGFGRYTRKIKKKRLLMIGNAQWPVYIKANFSVKKKRFSKFKLIKVLWTRSGFSKSPVGIKITIRRRRRKKKPIFMGAYIPKTPIMTNWI